MHPDKMGKKKMVPKMEAPCAASSKSSNGLAHNAEESCVKLFDWQCWVDIDEDSWAHGMAPTPGSPEAALFALYDLASKVRTDAVPLCAWC